jgi:hypothetical protein
MLSEELFVLKRTAKVQLKCIPLKLFYRLLIHRVIPLLYSVLFFQKAVAKISAEKFIPNKNLSQCADVEM